MSDKESGKQNEDKSDKAQQDSKNERGIVKNADMSEEIQSDALLIVTEALEKFKSEKDIVENIEDTMNKKHLPTWHCVIGPHYGSYVTPQTRLWKKNHYKKNYIYLAFGGVAVLLLKSE